MKSQQMFNIPIFKLDKNITVGDLISLKDDIYIINKELTNLNYEKANTLLNELYKSK